MRTGHLYETLPRTSSYSEEELASIGRTPYVNLEKEQRWRITGGRPGDLQIILDSALQEPSNESVAIAISAVCERAVHNSTNIENIASYPVFYYEVGKRADEFLIGQQG